MADWLKIAIKAGLVISIMALIVVLFTTVHVPAVDWTPFQSFGTFFAVIEHWFPAIKVIWPVVLALLGFEVALLTTKFALIGLKWVMKVNE